MLPGRASVVRFLLATGEVVISSSADAYTITGKQFMVWVWVCVCVWVLGLRFGY